MVLVVNVKLVIKVLVGVFNDVRVVPPSTEDLLLWDGCLLAHPDLPSHWGELVYLGNSFRKLSIALAR